jgi:inner membrane protein
MDSLSQIALGAAVGVAVMGRRTAVWKAAAWGAVAGTLPDLDVLIDHGDPIRNMVLHRAETHAPFWLTLFSLPFAALVARLSGERTLWRRWWLAMWLALVTHPLLDGDDGLRHPAGCCRSPTTPTAWAACSSSTRSTRCRCWSAASGRCAAAARGAWPPTPLGLAVSTAYLAWGVWAQQQVTGRGARRAGGAGHRGRAAAGDAGTAEHPAVARGGGAGWPLPRGFPVAARRGPGMVSTASTAALRCGRRCRGIDGAQRIAEFSHGFYKLHAKHGRRILVTDLRMGQEPAYVFSFAVAQRNSPPEPLAQVQQVSARPDLARALPWLWRRARGEPLPPPR